MAEQKDLRACCTQVVQDQVHNFVLDAVLRMGEKTSTPDGGLSYLQIDAIDYVTEYLVGHKMDLGRGDEQGVFRLYEFALWILPTTLVRGHQTRHRPKASDAIPGSNLHITG